MLSLIAIVAIGIVAVRLIQFFTHGSGGRQRTPSDAGNQPHPQLKQCPGCGAPVEASLDVCSNCGLRISA